MNASANQLYGICREFGFCVEDCGLCAQISGHSISEETRAKFTSAQQRRRAREREVFEVPELEPDEIEQARADTLPPRSKPLPSFTKFVKPAKAPKPARVRVKCPNCEEDFLSENTLKTHIEWKHGARKLPPATPVAWGDTTLKMCGWCRKKTGGHYAWCEHS